MRRNYRGFFWLNVFIWLTLSSQDLLGQRHAGGKPTASLPIEPASQDPEFASGPQADITEFEQFRGASETKSPITNSPGRTGFVTQLGLQMIREGFGSQLRLLQYAKPWMAVSENFRYRSQDSESALFRKQFGLLLGLELHPLRQSKLSPFLRLEAGGDRFIRGDDQSSLNLFGLEAHAGFELSLIRLASFVFQWTETYYPELKERLFVEQRSNLAYRGHFQVVVNFKLEKTL
jgi:hypothetical protein